MQSIAELLQEHPFFEGLEPEYIALIAGCGEERRVSRGRVHLP